jgi:hypothetical protein
MPALLPKSSDDRVPERAGVAALEEMVAHLNVEHFRRRLQHEKDETKRQMIWRLLAEEEAKLRYY